MDEPSAAPFPQRARTRQLSKAPKHRACRLRRRDLVVGLGVVAAVWPASLWAAPTENRKRIGILMAIAESDNEAQTRIATFQDALRKLNWMPGRNLEVEIRWGGGDPDRIQGAAAELAGLKPDVVLASGTSVLRALMAETRSLPVVFVQVADPVGAGLVANAEHPGGNLTGFTNFSDAMGGRWVGLLKEAAPRVNRVVIIRNPVAASAARMLHAVETMAPTLGVELNPVSAVDAADIKLVMGKFARQPNVGLIVLPDVIATVHRDLIIALAGTYQLPAIYPYRFFATSGGLMSYGVDTIDVYRRAGAYVNRILRGEQPGRLPVQEPSKFELVINLAAARTLGLALPQTLLAQANDVIE